MFVGIFKVTFEFILLLLWFDWLIYCYLIIVAEFLELKLLLLIWLELGFLIELGPLIFYRFIEMVAWPLE